ncbi:hypothetical protein EDB92DRAFT_1978690 [Lactarius akahatsu]|uniref:Uncharacterized protein n=1 Tax=Lactarius akahatsu TaxID=416441 RepID=A0AAD4L8J2_9AGAM|nr:hypothetical protein EDB92DRAFT_1978690 [Lactarius akahatsu]
MAQHAELLDFQQLGEHLASIADQVNLVPNLPTMNFNDLIAQHAQQHQELVGQFNDLQATVAGLQLDLQAAVGGLQAAVQAAVQAVVGELQAGIAAVQAGIATVQAGVDANLQLEPMRWANTRGSWDALVHYPQGVVIGPQFLLMQMELITLNAANAQVVSQALGLPASPQNAPIVAHWVTCGHPCVTVGLYMHTAGSLAGAGSQV